MKEITKMRRALKNLLVIMLLLSALLPCAGFAEEASSPAATANVAREELLALQGLLAWQRINEARVNPRAELERLGIPVEQALAALGDDAWILESGLPPLALNKQLLAAASLHGRDMFDRLYYSHVTPEGITPMERIAATGYQALTEDETLGILIFSGYVDLKLAVDFMVDTMIRDELVGTPGVRRNIFSPNFREVGAVFFAEAITLIEGQPYVYLFVLDFAAPVLSQRYLVGVYDAASARLPVMMPYATGQWSVQPVLTPGLFQVPYPDGGVALVLAGDGPETISDPAFVYDRGDSDNQYVDLRALR
jgi:hypothetical protein